MGFLDRYLSGDRERVWAELRALGLIERGHAQYDDARAVAAETMRRVRGNVEMVRTRLIDAGYELVAQGRAHVPPAADASAQLDAFERKHGSLPLSLRAFYEFVGTVNFMQSANQLVQWHKREDAPEPVAEVSYAGEYDPLVVQSLHHEDAEWDDRRRKHAWYLAPDECHKANYSGGMNYHVLLPDNGADFRIYGICNEEDRFGDWFVDYLRETFRGGGFRGGIAIDEDEVVGRELPDLAFTRQLAVGLEEIGDERNA
ncbi:hypothetical protein BJY16_005485 [Actinoplanes octamycinicus]|uniref:Uncharacterized protein n=1 Tax=Actinoplanes octamycinicus TaxID=135948 RepID=A0A7W7H127_9ACTN|nr:hypothetical protein [Actinoplanes octamycinicus]MBB4742026.1 hypothetical protein [Actinoplanes octamycinicus]